MIFTVNRDFAEWVDVFGGAVLATALLDWVLHHTTVVQIEGPGYGMRQHTGSMPGNARGIPSLVSPAPSKRPPTRSPTAYPTSQTGLITELAAVSEERTTDILSPLAGR